MQSLAKDKTTIIHPDDPDYAVDVSFDYRLGRLPSPHPPPLTLTDLLLGFFSHYLYDFDPSFHYISITTNPLLRADCPTAHIPPGLSFPVVDPFNLGYCPSRHVKLHSNLDSEYRQAMQVAIDRIQSQ